MENLSIAEYLKDKNILITGSTGFLAKIFVEKVLRVQPSVKRLFLVVRAADTNSAQKRVQNEIIAKDLFKALKEKHGEEFESLISKKVSAVAGDISCENLGIRDYNIREFLWKEIDVVVNVAANTNFYERYDVALGVNVLGAMNVLEFTKQCDQVKMLLHVSTAYVAGIKEGLITEKPLQFGEALKTGLILDIKEELRLLEERKTELSAENPSKDAEKEAMKELGIKRARTYGWPNTYVFTKAMGEMLLGHMRGDIPLVILRPTIITSIYKDPLPGWIEGARTIDSVILGYAKGNLTSFLGEPDMAADLIPGDMVVNAMIASMAAHSNQHSQFIYQVGSSVRNPIKYSTLLQLGHQYFLKNPRTSSDGKRIKTKKIHFLRTMSSFYRYMFFRYRLPLEVFRLVNIMLCCMFIQRFNQLWKKYKFMMRLADLYAPYAFFKGCFDDANLERLRMANKDSAEATLFDFDPKNIDWDDYFLNIHISGVLKHVSK